MNDIGFVQGVSVAERLRTFGGKLFRIEQHLQRLARSLEIVGIDLPQDLAELGSMAERLVAENHALLANGDDLGLCLFVTPGVSGWLADAVPPGPTVCMHTYPLPFHQFAHFYEQGQPLVVSKVRQVPTTCWPSELKCRSRMHYYLADKEAATAQPGARALLLDADGFVSEASTANIVIYQRDEGLISPPREKILPGVSIGVLEELAEATWVPFFYRDLTVEELLAADEAMLCSTSPCVWPVTQLGGQQIGKGKPEYAFRRLLGAWNDLVGIDIEAQAKRFSAR